MGDDAAPATEIMVDHPAAVGEARRVARSRAEGIGFPPNDVEELALVATELASNLVKHAGEGLLRIFQLSGDRQGIGIESTDLGPGIEHPDVALQDGVSTSASLGYGLGTVHRLMDEMEITSAPELERGTRIVCRRWLEGEEAPVRPLPLSFGVVSRPASGQGLSGDTYLIKRWGEHALVGAFDGLGHGQFAHRASQAARAYVERHHRAELQTLFQGTARACRGTRGVVMGVARFDLAIGSVAYGSVGNIEGRLWSAEERRGLLARRGVVGAGDRTPIVQHHLWTSESILVLHSDGLSSHWSWEEFLHLREVSPMEGARALFRRHATARDDAVVVVVKGGDG